MEDKEIHNIWKKIDSEIKSGSKEELNAILTIKTRKTINKYLYYIGSSAIISAGVITFLIITMLNRWQDVYYRMNNLLLLIFTLLALISSIWSIYNLTNNRTDLPLKEWLKKRTDMVSKWLNNKMAYYILPFVYILTLLSIHVYYENKAFLEVIKNDEDIFGMLFGFLTGLAVSYFFVVKIRKQQKKGLEYLKNLNNQINGTNQ